MDTRFAIWTLKTLYFGCYTVSKLSVLLNATALRDLSSYTTLAHSTSNLFITHRIKSVKSPPTASTLSTFSTSNRPSASVLSPSSCVPKWNSTPIPDGRDGFGAMWSVMGNEPFEGVCGDGKEREREGVGEPGRWRKMGSEVRVESRRSRVSSLGAFIKGKRELTVKQLVEGHGVDFSTLDGARGCFRRG